MERVPGAPVTAVIDELEGLLREHAQAAATDDHPEGASRLPWKVRTKLDNGKRHVDILWDDRLRRPDDPDWDWGIVAMGPHDDDLLELDARLIVAAVNALPILLAVARAADEWAQHGRPEALDALYERVMEMRAAKGGDNV